MERSKCRLLTYDTIAGTITPITDRTNRPTENNLCSLFQKITFLKKDSVRFFWDVLKIISGVHNYFRTFTVNRVVWEIWLTHNPLFFRGSVVECLTRDREFEPHQRHCVVVLRRVRPCFTERLLMERKESNQTKQSSLQINALKF